MAIAVSYPGVYIDEFTPASPIGGVSTSVAAFVGLAADGPVGVPTRISSLDDFTRVFGSHQPSVPVRHLPLSVAGFFRNGGSDCYVLRVSNAVAANLALSPNDGATPTLRLRAQVQGAAGEQVKVVVTSTSRLAKALADAGSPDASLVPATSSDLAVAAFPTGNADQARRRLDTNAAGVPRLSRFEVGDRIELEATDGTTARAEIAAISGTTVRLAAPVAGAADFTGGVFRLAAPTAGDRFLRVEVPPGLRLTTAVPVGTQLRITDTGGGSDEMVITTGVAGSRITLESALGAGYDPADTEVTSEEFDLAITDGEGRAETFEHLSMNPAHPRYWRTTTLAADIVVVEDPAVPLAGSDDPRPAPITTNLTGSEDDDPVTSAALLVGDLVAHLDRLATIDVISLVAVPGVTDDASQKAIVAHCEALGDRFAILDAQLALGTDDVITQRQGVTGDNKGFAAIYHPWIKITDAVTRTTPLWPPSGHIAGIYARTDATRGVHKAPANALVVGALDVERRLNDQMQGPLNLEGVNVIRVLPGMGSPVVWGARTTTTENKNWQHVNIRRLFLYLEESIAEGLRGSVFEPNDLALWERLKRTITEFLTRVWRDGALFGETAKDAFYVRIDEALNPPSTRQMGRLYVEIGVQPTYPAEFIIVRIGIWDGGAQVSES